MVRSTTLLLHIPTTPVGDLESGRYKYVYHGTKSEFKDIEEFKKQVKAEWESYEGLTVTSVDMVQVSAHKLETGWIWQDGLENITEDHTDLIIEFEVASPFPWVLLLIVIALAITAIIVYLLKGTFERLAEVVYKYPVIALAGIAVLALVVLYAMGVRVPKRKEETE